MAPATGQLHVFHVFGQRVVGCLDTKLHGQIQASQGFPLRDTPTKNNIGIGIVASARAIVVV